MTSFPPRANRAFLDDRLAISQPELIFTGSKEHHPKSDFRGSCAAINIRRLGPGDLKAIASVHVQSFPRTAISQLGDEAARRFYESLFSGPHETVGLGAFEEDDLRGFCFGGIWRHPEKHFLKTNKAFVVWRVLTRPWLMTEPFFRDRIRCGLRMMYPTRHKAPAAIMKQAASPCLVRSFGILYLAVDPLNRGRGIGRCLLQASEEVARQGGFEQMDLSVYLDNLSAIKLYERMQWQRQLSDGIWKGFMVKRLA